MRKMGAGLGSFVLGRNVATVEDRNYRNLLLSGAWFGPIEGGIFTYLSVFLARLGATRIGHQSVDVAAINDRHRDLPAGWGVRRAAK